MLKILQLFLFCFSITIYSQWSTSSLSIPRSLATSTSNGSQIFIGGGATYNLNKVQRVVDIYNVLTGSWSTDSISVGRFELASASTDNKVLFAGGVTNLNSFSISNVVDIYDVNSGTWETAALSQSRGALVGTSNGTKALFAGGVKNYSSGIGSNVVDIYDETTNNWSVDTLTVPHSFYTAVTAGNRAYFAGGIVSYSGNNTVLTNRIDIYDYNTGTWSIDSLSVARGGLASATVGTKILFAGGHDPNYNALNIVDIFDYSTNTWSTDTLSQARGELTGVSLGDKVYFAGGYSNYGTYTMSDRVDIYDNSTGLWTTATLSAARAELCSSSAGNKLLISAGGSYSTTEQFDNVDIYTDNTSSVNDEKKSKTTFKLSQNFPNPFNPATSMHYTISSRRFVTLKVYDILGNEIATLVNEEKPAGSYEVEFNSHSDEGRNLSSGIYFYKIEAGQFVETKKMILLK